MNEMHRYLPWQSSYWSVLQNRREQNTLPHALLLTGVSGIGKKQFAQALAESLLCLSPKENHLACGHCRQCQLIAAGNHPDYLEIFPDSDSKVIKIDQIRDLIDTVSKTPQVAPMQIILINPADVLNLNAVNALLKTLEEPMGNVLMILITERLMALPATVRSRCQMIHFATPNEKQACEWLNDQSIQQDQLPLLLQLANGAPLKVLQLIEQDELTFRAQLFKKWYQLTTNQTDLVSVSQSWAKEDIARILNHWMSWTRDLIHIKQDDKNNAINQDIIKQLIEIGSTRKLKHLHKFYAKMLETLRFIHSSVNLNPQMMIEDLLIAWLDVITC